MAQPSHVYLHLASIGDVEASAAALAAGRPLLKSMYARGELLGYRLFRVKDRDAAEEELLHHMFDFEAATRQRYPFVYASMTPLGSEASGPAIASADRAARRHMMQKKNLHASLFFFDARDPSDVRSTLAGALHCIFDEEFAKSDELGTTWFGDVFGFEISFHLVSQRDDGAWYTVAIGPSSDIFEAEAPMEEIEFHLSQMLQRAGFSTVVTMPEYRARYHKPAP